MTDVTLAEMRDQEDLFRVEMQLMKKSHEQERSSLQERFA